MNLQGRNLSINLLGQDVQLLQSELQQLGFKIPDDELQKSAFGEGTQDAVLQFQKQNGLQANGVVDDETAKEINKRVAELNAQPSMHGQVRLEDGSPLAVVVVSAFDQDLRAEEILGKTTTDANGRYPIQYNSTQFACAEKDAADLIVRVFNAANSVIAVLELLGSLAHNVVVWARRWLTSLQIQRCGTLRMVRDVFHISGLLRFDALTHVVEILLNQDARLAHSLIHPLREVLSPF